MISAAGISVNGTRRGEKKGRVRVKLNQREQSVCLSSGYLTDVWLPGKRQGKMKSTGNRKSEAVFNQEVQLFNKAPF